VPEVAATYDDAEVESGLTFIGLMGLADPPRPEAAEAVTKCRGAGIKVIMLTGDASRTALSVARQVGLAGQNAVVVEGPEVDRMTDAELRDRMSGAEVIFSRVTPATRCGWYRC